MEEEVEWSDLGEECVVKYTLPKTDAHLGLNHVYLPIHLLSKLSVVKEVSLKQVQPVSLAVELSSRSGHRWNLAWFGCRPYSPGPIIEIGRPLAERISLPEHTVVRAKVAAPALIPHAEEIILELHSEDDRKLVECYPDHTLKALARQIGIFHEGMILKLFWGMPNYSAVNCHVVSTFPEKSVVRMVPGTMFSFTTPQEVSLKIQL